MARAGGGGGGRSGGGGGGRSFGGGGGRSFGGRSGGGGVSRGGGSPGRSGGYSGGGYGGGYGGGPRRTGPIFAPMFFGGFGRRRYGGGGGGCGCISIPIILLVVALLVVFIAGGVPSCGASGGGNSAVTASTVEREPLPAGSVVETDYYTDELSWVRSSSTLTAGMKNFYKKTGVQPYLYITDTIDGSHAPTAAQVEEFAYRVYDELFEDEAHFLLIFFEYNEVYHTWYLAGSQAKTVMDAEATDILLDYIDRYYYEQGLTDDEFFSKAFDDAGNRIMSVTRSPWIAVAIVAVIAVLVIVGFVWWSRAKAQKNKEAQQTETILNTPLESFGSTEAEDLAKKYDKDNQ